MKILNVPHFQQSASHTCVPTCVRMVLAYWGHNYSEAELSAALKTVPGLGTPFDEITPGLQQLGLRAMLFENADIKRLRRLIESNWPIIIFLDVSDIVPGKRGFHAVVVIGASEKQIFCLDPEQDIPTQLTVNQFERMWARMHNLGLVIWQ